MLRAPGTGGGQAMGLQRPAFENRWPPAAWFWISTPEETRFPDCQPPSPPRTGMPRASPATVWRVFQAGAVPFPVATPSSMRQAGPPRGAKPDLGVAARPDRSSTKQASGSGLGTPVLHKDLHSGTSGSRPPSPAARPRS